ncbi:hypothetical protein D3C81_1937050 [compost metagenome]
MRRRSSTIVSSIVIKFGTFLVLIIILAKAIKEGGHFCEDDFVPVVKEVALLLDQIVCG